MISVKKYYFLEHCLVKFQEVCTPFKSPKLGFFVVWRGGRRHTKRPTMAIATGEWLSALDGTAALQTFINRPAAETLTEASLRSPPKSQIPKIEIPKSKVQAFQ